MIPFSSVDDFKEKVKTGGYIMYRAWRDPVLVTAVGKTRFLYMGFRGDERVSAINLKDWFWIEPKLEPVRELK